MALGSGGRRRRWRGKMKQQLTDRQITLCSTVRVLSFCLLSVSGKQEQSCEEALVVPADDKAKKAKKQKRTVKCFQHPAAFSSQQPLNRCIQSHFQPEATTTTTTT